MLAEIGGEASPVDTPFGRPSAPILRARWEGTEIAILPRHGSHHTLPPTAVPYRANIFALKSLGVTHILASGATGSLREEIRPRDLVIPDQVIDKTTRRAASFFDRPGIACHIDFAEPFCPSLREMLIQTGRAIAATLHEEGTYVCMEGPAFSTAAECRMHRSWGGDLIGMTCLPEAKLAREAEICYALVALPTDYDCWRPHDPAIDRETILKEIIRNVEVATANSVKLFKAALRAIASETLPPCACRHALDLAVWTAPDHIDRSILDQMQPILARRFTKPGR